MVVESECSNWYPVPAGVRQGSVLGSMLFTLFINDLPSSLTNRSLLFADDMKVFLQVFNDYDCVALQDDMTRLHAWCTTWYLILTSNVFCNEHFIKEETCHVSLCSI